MRGGGETRDKAGPRASFEQQERPSPNRVSSCVTGPVCRRSSRKEVELGALEKLSVPSGPGGSSGGNGKGKTSGRPGPSEYIHLHHQRFGLRPSLPISHQLLLPFPGGREQRAALLAPGSPALLRPSNLR